MVSDWKNPDVLLSELATSPDPLDRIKAEVFYEVRKDPSLDGDSLFVQRTRDYINKSISDSLTRYISSSNNQQTYKEIKNSINHVINSVYSDISATYSTSVSITRDKQDPAGLKIDVTTVVDTEEE